MNDTKIKELAEEIAKALKATETVSEVATFSAEDAEFSDAKYSEDGKTVTREGVIFEIGDYPDKKFSITEDEAKTYADNFTPVTFKVEHDVDIPEKPTLESIRVADGKIYGKARIPTWLDKLNFAKTVSCGWDRTSKTLNEISFVKCPRIASAALFSEDVEEVAHDTNIEFAAADTEEITMDNKSLLEKFIAWFNGNELKEEAAESVEEVHEDPADFSAEVYVETEEDKLKAENIALKAQVEAEKSAKFSVEANTFADNLIAASKAIPAEKEAIIVAYHAAANFDANKPAEFSETVSAVDAMKILFEAKPVHTFTMTAEETVDAIKNGELNLITDNKGANFSEGASLDQSVKDPATIAKMRQHLGIK